MVLHAPSVWERRSLPALIKASLRNQIGLFLFQSGGEILRKERSGFRQRERISSRELVPDFPIDLLERFFHPLFDLLSLLVKVFELSEMFHPRLFLGGSFQFLLDRLGSIRLAGAPANLSG